MSPLSDFECPSCGSPAQVLDRFILGGSPGPVEHVKIRCTHGHWSTPPVASLRSSRSPAGLDRHHAMHAALAGVRAHLG